MTTTYGQASTADSVAEGLASAINGASLGFTATTASPGALTVTANQPGPEYNGLPLSIASATDEPSLFPSPSFTGTSGAFAGGQDSTIYSYSIPSPGTATTGYAANGNLLSYSDTLNGIADTWNFTANSMPCYQPLNRITCANATAGPWGPVDNQPGLSLSWAYDSFGNRTTQTVSGSPSLPAPQTESAQYTTSNNHVTFATTAPNGFSYDNAGNVTDDGINQYAYDGEGRLCAVRNKITQNTTGYAYDGLGNRVAKGTIGTFNCNMSPTGGNGFTATTNFIVGQDGEQLDELDAQGNGLHSNVYANGQLLATYVFSQSDWMYAFSDWLGTKRVTTDASGAITQTCLSLPFGDALNCSGGIDPSEHHFTGKERDTESGLDYFGARHYASTMGRFLSPDSGADSTLGVPVPFADLENPQSLNLYSYVHNNPVSKTDLDGHATWGDCLDGSGYWCRFGDYNGEPDQQNGRTVYWNAANGNWDNNDPTKMNDGRINDLSGGQLLMAVPIGKLVGPLVGSAASKVGEVLSGALGKATAESAAQGGAKMLLTDGTKQAAKTVVDGMADGAQKASVKRAVAGAISRDSISIAEHADGSITVTKVRPGADGFQAIVKNVDPSGASVTIQGAYDAEGNLVHLDPKN